MKALIVDDDRVELFLREWDVHAVTDHERDRDRPDPMPSLHHDGRDVQTEQPEVSMVSVQSRQPVTGPAAEFEDTTPCSGKRREGAHREVIGWRRRIGVPVHTGGEMGDNGRFNFHSFFRRTMM